MTSPPKILHIVPALLGPTGLYGGAERYALELSRAMSRRAPTRLVSFTSAGALPARSRQDALSIFTVRNWLRSRRFAGSPAGPGLIPHLAWADIVHCHQPHTMSSTLALLYTRIRPKPIFATDHNGGGLSLQSFVDTYAWYTGHLYVSEFARRLDRCARAGPLSRIIWGGVDPGRFSPAAVPEPRQEVLFVGRLIPAKGVDVLIAAAGSEIPVAVLGPVYDPEYARRLRHLAAGLPVRFLPPAADEALLAAYRRALCVVLPSVALPGRDAAGAEVNALPEALGLTLLEAMACATPVICTRVGGMPEIVMDGETGFIVPPNDPAALRERLRFLRANPDAARHMGDCARRHVLDHFTWDAVAVRCLDAYAAANPRANPSPASGDSR